jgi:oligopeptide/dipeptide ABC transporter ATP-binding protein
LRRGETIGLVGESGCGKSTLVRVLARLIDATEGSIRFDEIDLAAIPASQFPRHPARSRIQMVFQDPSDSLNPRFTAFDTIAEPVRLLVPRKAASAEPRDALATRIAGLADSVGLPRELLSRFPHQLSGGQKARVGIARALACDPELLILDEPTSALDVSVQAIILQLLARLRSERGLSYLFVSHDLNVVRLLCDRIVVMYLGRVVEVGPTAQVFSEPKHPYTQALISAIPGLGPRVTLSGEVRSPIDPPLNVCRFYGRCPVGAPRCAQVMPLLHQVISNSAAEHEVACHFA